jgi:hypothetical protein
MRVQLHLALIQVQFLEVLPACPERVAADVSSIAVLGVGDTCFEPLAICGTSALSSLGLYVPLTCRQSRDFVNERQGAFEIARPERTLQIFEKFFCIWKGDRWWPTCISVLGLEDVVGEEGF